MMITKKLIISSLLVANFFSFSPSGVFAAPSKGGVLFIQQKEKPYSLNPLFCSAKDAKNIHKLIYSGLIGIDKNLEYFPDLAISVPTSENGGLIIKNGRMIVNYKIKETAFWHDGKPVTSDDVRFTWELIVNPLIKKDPSWDFSGYQKISKIETTDSKTVSIHFKEVYRDYNRLFSYILPKHCFFPRHVFEIDQNHPFNFKPIGSGPFRFVEINKNDSLVFEANKKYYRNTPFLGQIIYSYGAFPSVAKISGNHLFKELTAEQASSLIAENKNLKEIQISEDFVYGLAFNDQSPILQKEQLKRALALSLDRSDFGKRFPDYQEIWSELYPSAFSNEISLKKLYGFNLKEAQRILTENGFEIIEGKLYDKNRNQLRLKVLTLADPIYQKINEYLLEQWQRIGIDISTEFVSADVLKNKTADPSAYDLVICQRNILSNLYEGKKYLTLKNFPPVGENYSRFSNSLSDSFFLNKGLKTKPEEQKIVIDLINKKLPFLPLLNGISRDVFSKEFHNYQPSSFVGDSWNSFEWWLD